MQARSDIAQSPDSVAIRHEMIHETRVIPLDARPRVAAASAMTWLTHHAMRNILSAARAAEQDSTVQR